MSVVTIHKKNEVYLHVETEPSVALELKDFFSFIVPGAQFTPQFRSKMWDGRINLYNVFTKELYIGLIPYIKDFCKSNDYKFVNNCKDIKDDISSLEDFLSGLQFRSAGKSIEVRDYQIAAIREALECNRTLLLSPTGSGKSLIIYSIMRWHQEHNRKQLIIVPTTSLVEQLYADFADYASATDWRVSENCVRIYSGKEKDFVHVKISCENGIVYMFDCNENIKLINSNVPYKHAKDVTTDDEIDDKWLQKHNQKQIL